MKSLMMCIGPINRLAILHRSLELEAEGINGIQHSYVMRICQQPGITQDQLARQLYVHKSNVARQLALLESGGFLTRVPKENDRRALQIYPTEKMQSAFPKVRAVLDEWNAYLLEDFSPEQRENLIGMLERVLDKAQRRVEEEQGKGDPA